VTERRRQVLTFVLFARFVVKFVFVPSTILSSLSAEFRRYKALGDSALAQLEDAELALPGPNGGNSAAVLVWHIGGNLASRFTDFLTSDGEKAWRHRDEEFVQRAVTRHEVVEKWDAGWNALFHALDALTDGHLQTTTRFTGRSHIFRITLVRSCTSPNRSAAIRGPV